MALLHDKHRVCPQVPMQGRLPSSLLSYGLKQIVQFNVEVDVADTNKMLMTISNMNESLPLDIKFFSMEGLKFFSQIL